MCGKSLSTKVRTYDPNDHNTFRFVALAMDVELIGVYIKLVLLKRAPKLFNNFFFTKPLTIQVFDIKRYSGFVTVRDKIKRDEDAEKANKEGEQNMSSGGSYYEACGDDGSLTFLFRNTHNMTIKPQVYGNGLFS